MQLEGEAAAMAPQRTDVLVIGGGPGGSSAAITLAERGYSVVLLEKSRHPRFHIGESLLPANLPIFERLGVAQQIRDIGLEKWGAEFVSPWHNHAETFEFSEAWPRQVPPESLPFAYQVRRSQFDEILIRRAANQGAQVIEGCRARDVRFLPGEEGVCVQAEHDDGGTSSWQARYLIDASGRDTFMGNRLNVKHRNPRHNSSAMYAHFKGALRYADCRREGNISIYWFDHGWLWFIPLADGATSIGAVVWPYYMKSRTRPLREFFLETIALSPALAERLRNAELVSEVEATGNYAYQCGRSYGESFLLVGDAYAFIDPMFSTGVMLAMKSGIEAAETVDLCLRQPARKVAALKRFDRLMRWGPKAYTWFIYRVTNPTMRDLFMGPRNTLRMKEALLSLLSGDIFGDTPFWGALRAFKMLYYVISLVHLRRSLAAARRRVVNIQPAEPDRMAAG